MFSTLKVETLQSGLEAPIYTWVRGGSESTRNDDSYRLILGCPQEDGVDGNEIITIHSDKSITFDGEVSLSDVSFNAGSINADSLIDGTFDYKKFSPACLNTLRENMMQDSEGNSVLQSYVRLQPLSDEKDFDHRSIAYCYGKEEDRKDLIAPHLLRKLWMWNGTSEDANDVAVPALTDYTINLSNRLDESYLGLTAETLQSRLQGDKSGILYLIAHNFVELVSQAIKLMTPEQLAEIAMAIGVADGSINIDTSKLVQLDANGNLTIPGTMTAKNVKATSSVTAPNINATSALAYAVDGEMINAGQAVTLDSDGNLTVEGNLIVNGSMTCLSGNADFMVVNATEGIATTTMTVKNLAVTGQVVADNAPATFKSVSTTETA